MRNTSTTYQESDAASLTWAVAVPTGTVQTFQLKASISAYDNTNAILVADGGITATYFPFSEDGDDILNVDDDGEALNR